MNEEGLGRCLCGAVQFKVEGQPIYNVVCHCTNCKRTSGSTFHTASIYFRKQYTLLKPTAVDFTAKLENISVYADHDTKSGKPLYRRFCSICGSKISALTPLNEEIISIPAGVLPLAGQEWVPQREQFMVDKVGWVPELGDLIQSMHGPGSKEVQTPAAKAAS